MSADGAGTMVVAAAPSGAAATASAGADPRQGNLDEATELEEEQCARREGMPPSRRDEVYGAHPDRLLQLRGEDDQRARHQVRPSPGVRGAGRAVRQACAAPGQSSHLSARECLHGNPFKNP